MARAPVYARHAGHCCANRHPASARRETIEVGSGLHGGGPGHGKNVSRGVENAGRCSVSLVPVAKNEEACGVFGLPNGPIGMGDRMPSLSLPALTEPSLMWDRQKLSDMARARKAALSDVEAALLAFARTQELTDEPAVDVKAAEKELEAALEKLEPEAAGKLNHIGSVERDEVLRDFLVAMVQHNQQRIERDLEDVQLLEVSQSLAAPNVGETVPEKKRKRRLGLFRR